MVGRLLIIGGAALVAYFLFVQRKPAVPRSASGLVLDPHAAHSATTYAPPATSVAPSSSDRTAAMVGAIGAGGTCAALGAAPLSPLCAAGGAYIAPPVVNTAKDVYRTVASWF